MMNRTRIGQVALAAVAVAALGTSMPQSAKADSYYRTYSVTRTTASPTLLRTVSSPVMAERIVTSPVMVEQCVEKPVLIEKVIEKPVFVEKLIERPMLIEKQISSPVIIEQKPRRHLLNFSIL